MANAYEARHEIGKPVQSEILTWRTEGGLFYEILTVFR
jgi:hypothetical protein